MSLVGRERARGRRGDGAKERIISGAGEPEDEPMEKSLRPQKLADFIGQDKVKEQLSITIQAARARGEQADHLLFHGPPGLGKTTLAGILASEMGAQVRVSSGPALQRPGDLAALLLELSDRDVLFIDEIHRLPRPVEEALYPALEDFAFDIMLGKGPASRAVRLDLKKFTLVGATTRAGAISGPLRDRFGLSIRLEYYSLENLEAILLRSAGVLGVPLDIKASKIIAGRSRGTPRVANKLLRRARDYAQVRKSGVIDETSALEAMKELEIDEEGLDAMDRRILTAVLDQFKGGPVGLEALGATLGEDSATLEDMYEPHLLQKGFLVRTPSGRKAGDKAYSHLGRKGPGLNPSLF